MDFRTWGPLQNVQNAGNENGPGQGMENQNTVLSNSRQPSTSIGRQFSHQLEHPVGCDNCEISKISGFRYKCITCRNFNLCQACERSGHAGHVMIRIPFPELANEAIPIQRYFDVLNQRRPSSYGIFRGGRGRGRGGQGRAAEPGVAEPAAVDGQGLGILQLPTSTQLTVPIQTQQQQIQNVMSGFANANPTGLGRHQQQQQQQQPTPVPVTNPSGTPDPIIIGHGPQGSFVFNEQMDVTLSLLLGLGFSNNDGSLARLVHAKDGDLNTILDHLFPQDM